MRVASTTDIAVPIADVWSFVSELENGPIWQESAEWTRVTTPKPVGVGTRMSHRARWMGTSFLTEAEVTGFDAPSRLTYEIRSRFGKSEMSYQLQELPHGTRLTLSNDGKLPTWLRPIQTLLQRQVQAMTDRDIGRLKVAVEGKQNTL